MTCPRERPKERTLWPEEEPNPNEPETLVIELPIPMPTWNRILQMQHFERMKLRHLLHQFVCTSTIDARGLQTSTDSASKPSSTVLLRLEYFATIRPNKSRKSVIRNLKQALTKKKKPS